MFPAYKSFKATLQSIAEILNANDITWCLGASSSLYVQNVPVTPNDLDIIVDINEFDKVYKLLSALHPSESEEGAFGDEKYRKTELQQVGFPAEIVGFSINGSAFIRYGWEGIQLIVHPLEVEVEIYKKRPGKERTIALIEDVLRNNQRLYLFTLEVMPLNVGKIYNPLPSHLTLMSRFWSSLSPEELSQVVKPLFQRTQPMELIFGESAALGPKQIAVHLIENTDELKNLHSKLRGLLNAAGVTYTTPKYTGDGHKPHVSKRDGDQFIPGHKQMANAVYLVEVEIKGDDHLRFIRAKFDLKG
jgi:hypothetical protein